MMDNEDVSSKNWKIKWGGICIIRLSDIFDIFIVEEVIFENGE